MQDYYLAVQSEAHGGGNRSECRHSWLDGANGGRGTEYLRHEEALLCGLSLGKMSAEEEQERLGFLYMSFWANDFDPDIYAGDPWMVCNSRTRKILECCDFTRFRFLPVPAFPQQMRKTLIQDEFFILFPEDSFSCLKPDSYVRPSHRRVEDDKSPLFTWRFLKDCYIGRDHSLTHMPPGDLHAFRDPSYPANLILSGRFRTFLRQNHIFGLDYRNLQPLP